MIEIQRLRRSRFLARFLACFLVIAATASSLDAQAVTTIRLVSCGTADCVLIRGHRRSPTAVVQVNERPVDVRGRTSWQVRLPIATVRDWSAPLARTLRIAVTGPAGSVERDDAVRLPVGLLGQKVELASLTVRAR